MSQTMMIIRCPVDNTEVFMGLGNKSCNSVNDLQGCGRTWLTQDWYRLTPRRGRGDVWRAFVSILWGARGFSSFPTISEQPPSSGATKPAQEGT